MKAYKRVKLEPNLTTRSLFPENQEAPIRFLPHYYIPDKYFYRRNHLPYPMLNRQAFFLPIDGEVERPLVVNYMNLMTMPNKTVEMVLECSGNKRANF